MQPSGSRAAGRARGEAAVPGGRATPAKKIASTIPDPRQPRWLHPNLTGPTLTLTGPTLTPTGPTLALFFSRNRCYKPLSNLEVSRARSNNDSSL